MKATIPVLNVSIFSLLLCIPVKNFAAEIFPPKCKPVNIQKKLILKKGQKTRLILLHNFSNNVLWVTRAMSQEKPNILTSELHANQWSALALQDKIFELSCVESSPGHEQEVPCHTVLSACEWTDVTMNTTSNDSYFPSENISLAALKTDLSKQGFVLPDKKG